MLGVGFEPKIPASERAKAVHALDRSANVTGDIIINVHKICYKLFAAYKEWLNVLKVVLGSQ
jgi:hypothetical protein